MQFPYFKWPKLSVHEVLVFIFCLQWLTSHNREDCSQYFGTSFKRLSTSPILKLPGITRLKVGQLKDWFSAQASQAAYRVVDEGIQSLASSTGSKPSSPERLPHGETEFEIQEASEWPDIKPETVFLSPPACRQLWRQFTSDSSFIVQQAQATQVEQLWKQCWV